MDIRILRDQQGWDDSCYIELLERFIASKNLTVELINDLLLTAKSDEELTKELEDYFEAPIRLRIPIQKITTSIRKPIVIEE
jgi:hypothetical protein